VTSGTITFKGQNLLDLSPNERAKLGLALAFQYPVAIPGVGTFEGIKTSVFLEVEGAAHYLPAYAGNLDIMTSAGLKTAEKIAQRKLMKKAA